MKNLDSRKLLIPGTNRTDERAGATVAERSASVAASVTDHMSKAVALEQLHAMCRCQHHVIDRVYEYWKDKRKRTQRPSLRRLQVRLDDRLDAPSVCDARLYIERSRSCRG